jgi:hypothetical protein
VRLNTCMFWTARCRTRPQAPGCPFDFSTRAGKFFDVAWGLPKLLKILTERVKWHARTYPVVVIVQPIFDTWHEFARFTQLRLRKATMFVCLSYGDSVPDGVDSFGWQSERVYIWLRHEYINTHRSSTSILISSSSFFTHSLISSVTL